MKKFELVSLCMYLLGGDSKALDIEDIAMKCEEMSPGTFAWRKYKNQINLELVGFAVRDAKKQTYGQLVTGSHAKGWRLTASGVAVAKSLKSKLSDATNINIAPAKSRNLELNRANRELKRISESLAYMNWKNEIEVSVKDLLQLLRINTYSSKESVDIKLARLSAVTGFESEIDDFVEYVISRKEELI